MTHSFMTSAFQSASSQVSKSKKSRRSYKLNNSNQPSLFDNLDEQEVEAIPEQVERKVWEPEEKSLRIWQAVALDYEGEEHTTYVEAATDEEANNLATKIFTDDRIGIYQMFIYRF